MRTTHQHNVRSDSGSGYRFTIRKLLGSMLLIGIVLVIGTNLFQEVQQARRTAVNQSVGIELKQLGIALLNYHAVYDSFPSAYVADDNGRPIHSWRILILPFADTGSQVLYQQYDFNEPWDGPNNSKLHNQMPYWFHATGEDQSDSHTNFVAITGPGTAFPGNQSTSLSDFADGEDVIMLTEVSGSRINWLKPVDIDVATGGLNPNGSGIHISAVKWRRPYVVTSQGSVLPVGSHVREADLKALATINGGEPVTKSILHQEK